MIHEFDALFLLSLGSMKISNFCRMIAVYHCPFVLNHFALHRNARLLCNLQKYKKVLKWLVDKIDE